MQLFDTKSLRLQLFEEVHALAANTHFIDMVIKFEIGIDKTPSSASPLTRSTWGKRSGREKRWLGAVINKLFCFLNIKLHFIEAGRPLDFVCG